MNERNVSIYLHESDGPHGADMGASLRRVARCVTLVVAHRPISGAKLLRLLQRAEVEIEGITMPEIEYASYLAGMADRVR